MRRYLMMILVVTTIIAAVQCQWSNGQESRAAVQEKKLSNLQPNIKKNSNSTIPTSNNPTISNSQFNLRTIQGQMSYLMAKHKSYMQMMFQKMENEMRQFDALEQQFLTEVNFINESTTQNFFENIKANIENGNAPELPGSYNISYTSYTNINGIVKSVHYQYQSDGENITLVKSTNNNGMIIKAMYQYDVKGKLLNVKEYKGDKLIHQKKHTIEV